MPPCTVPTSAASTQNSVVAVVRAALYASCLAAVRGVNVQIGPNGGQRGDGGLSACLAGKRIVHAVRFARLTDIVLNHAVKRGGAVLGGQLVPRGLHKVDAQIAPDLLVRLIGKRNVLRGDARARGGDVVQLVGFDEPPHKEPYAADAEVDHDGGDDHFNRAELIGQFAEENRAGRRDKLRNEQRQYHARRTEAERSAVVRGQRDDRAPRRRYRENTR